MISARLCNCLSALLFFGLILLVASPAPAVQGSASAVGAGVKENAELAAARAALAAEPQNPRLHTQLGYLLLDFAALEEAMRHFDEALILKATTFEAKTGRGIVLARMGKLQEAEQVLKAALLLNPDPVRTHYELGRLYQKLGDNAKAVTEFKEGIRKHEQGRN